jgi:hypothetical protein
MKITYSIFCESILITITTLGHINPWGETRRFHEKSNLNQWARSSRFHKSAACIIFIDEPHDVGDCGRLLR